MSVLSPTPVHMLESALHGLNTSLSRGPSRVATKVSVYSTTHLCMSACIVCVQYAIVFTYLNFSLIRTNSLWHLTNGVQITEDSLHPKYHLSEFPCETRPIFPEQLTSLPHEHYYDVQHSIFISGTIDIPKRANWYVHTCCM